MYRIFAQYYSEALREYALLQDQDISVHSVFQTGMNLLLGERLLYVGSDASAMRPFGIVVRADEFTLLRAHCQQGATGCYNKGKNNIQWGSGIALDFSRADLWTGSVVPREKNWMLLLSEGVAEWRRFFQKKHLEYGLSQEFPTEDAMIQALKRVVALHPTEVFEQLDFWIGRGPGLTPSGDDMLVGLLAALQWGEETTFGEIVAAYMDQKGRRRTTAVSYEYLFYATKGVYSREICVLLDRLSRGEDWHGTLLALLALGHSSGADTALGLLAGLESLLPFQ